LVVPLLPSRDVGLCLSARTGRVEQIDAALFPAKQHPLPFVR
jgi:hypothetical protein